jgi:Fe-S-cluster-containing hydrogenase component 2
LAAGSIEIDLELCKDCKLCISVCPYQLIESSDRMNQKGYYPAYFVEKHLKKEQSELEQQTYERIFRNKIIKKAK